MTSPILAVEGLSKHFAMGRGQKVHAVNDVGFSIRPGQTVGLVGESGSGKSTIGRTVLRLLQPTGGRILFDGQDITALSEAECMPLRPRMQMVFQDPWSALNPRHSARRLIEEPLLLHARLGKAERRERAEALAERVHLDRAMLDRLPGELSGGQLQRVCVARAIATDPKLIVLDEPTSSLDLSVRAGILELLAEIRATTGAGMLFITHDLGTLRLISDEVVVLYLGSVMERAPTRRIFEEPEHPYTRALISAHLSPDPSHRPERIRLEGEIPSPISLPPGCPFASRCPDARDACRATRPPLVSRHGGSAEAACIRIDEPRTGARA
ncbi:MAG: ABC transporter ATP-binding protein [Alphaproteobacteria bacterium]|nr:ABC transporter ATP-binding protein [Alphaproteobacteria bacterium]